MVNHVRFLMHMRLYGMLQSFCGPIDGWVSLAKYWGPGPWSPMTDAHFQPGAICTYVYVYHAYWLSSSIDWCSYSVV